LVLRYALHVEHADRNRMRQLLTTACTEGASRDQIRQILGTCGAFEYGMSSVLFYADAARRWLEAQPFDPRYLTAFLERLTAPTRNVLASLGIGAGELSQHLAQAFGSAASAA